MPVFSITNRVFRLKTEGYIEKSKIICLVVTSAILSTMLEGTKTATRRF